jgi:predicted DNA-binding transcriptional regulator AlpA
LRIDNIFDISKLMRQEVTSASSTPTFRDDGLAILRDRIENAAVTSLPMVIAELASLQARAVARMLRQQNGSLARAERTEDVLVSADEAAHRLGVSRFWIYRNWKHLPFARRVGRRALRFSSHGIARYAQQRHG